MVYLQQRGSQQRTDKAETMFFYALWLIYALSAVTMILDTVVFCWPFVSVDDDNCLTLFQFVLQNVKTQYHLNIIEATVFALCNFMAQIILVRTTGNTYHYLSNFLKDISLLDYLGLQHSCCDRSIILSIRIIRYINSSSFTG